MYAASLAGLALIIGLLAVAAIGLGLLTRAGRDRVVLARLTSFFAILTLVGVGISMAVLGYVLLSGADVGVTVPVQIVQRIVEFGIQTIGVFPQIGHAIAVAIRIRIPRIGPQLVLAPVGQPVAVRVPQPLVHLR